MPGLTIPFLISTSDEKMDLFQLSIQVVEEVGKVEEDDEDEDEDEVIEGHKIEERVPNSHSHQLRLLECRSGEEEQFKGELQLISLDQVAAHDTFDDCWVVIYDYVYDCTEFLKKHPGGQDILVEYAGRDATLAFVGAGHSSSAQHLLSRYLIGELPFVEKIFRKPGGIRIV